MCRGTRRLWECIACLFCPTLPCVDKAADSAVDGIGSFELYEVSRDGDNDLLRPGNGARHILVGFAHEDIVSLPKHDQRWYAQLLHSFVSTPFCQDIRVHPFERALWGE